jgi:hypothetical protein
LDHTNYPFKGCYCSDYTTSHTVVYLATNKTSSDIG